MASLPSCWAHCQAESRAIKDEAQLLGDQAERLHRQGPDTQEGEAKIDRAGLQRVKVIYAPW